LRVDAKSHSDYPYHMSNVTSQNDWGCLGRAKRLGRGLTAATLAALPLGGLIFFFEMTQPAQVYSGAIAAELSTAAAPSPAVKPGQRYAVAQLAGVSAELRQNAAGPQTKLLSAGDAERALASAPYDKLKTGYRVEFVNKDHHRVALRIVGRQPVTDEAVPDNARLMDMAPASTANRVSFVWGPWLYTVEVEDKGVEPEIAVQSVL